MIILQNLNEVSRIHEAMYRIDPTGKRFGMGYLSRQA